MADLGTRPRLALVGADSLLAKEIRDLLEDARPAPHIELISAAPPPAANVPVLEALLEAEDEEAIVLTPLAAESLEGANVAFLAGSAASSRRALKLNPPDGPRLIDLTGALEDQPHARLRAPSAEPAPPPAAPGAIQIIAHPASAVLATLLVAISSVGPIRRSIIHVFEPASERGKQALEELQQQTVAVLSFKKLKTDVFDAQLGFNLLARYGEEALEPLDIIEQRVERHLASLLAAYPGIPMPSLRLIQAPVFHGHSFSIWMEFEEHPDLAAVAHALEERGIDVRAGDPPSNANIAGQSGASVGAISADPNQPRACWLWMVSDNLKLAAENAVAVARELLQ